MLCVIWPAAFITHDQIIMLCHFYVFRNHLNNCSNAWHVCRHTWHWHTVWAFKTITFFCFCFFKLGELRSLWQQCVFKNMNIEPLFCFQAFSGDFVAWGFWSNFTCYRYFSYSFSLHDFVLVFFTLYLKFPVSCFGWAMLE